MLSEKCLNWLILQINKYYVPSLSSTEIGIIIEKLEEEIIINIASDSRNLVEGIFYDNRIFSNMMWLDTIKVKKNFEVKKIKKLKKNFKLENFISTIDDHLIEFNFRLRGLDFSNYIENLSLFVRKIFLINTHLNFSIILKHKYNFEILLQLDSNTLATPLINNIKNYLEDEYGIDPSCMFDFEEYFNKEKIESIFIFSENRIKNNFNYLEIVVYENRQYNEFSNNTIYDLTNNSNFSRILKKNYIKLKNLDNLNSIPIKNSNDKNITIIINIIQKNNNYIQNILNHIENAFIKIKKLNIFLLMEKCERKIYRMYQRDMDIISSSLLSLSINCFNQNIQEKMKKLLNYNDECDEAILSNRLNLILYKHSLIK